MYLILIGQWPMAKQKRIKIITRTVFLAMQVLFTMPHLISAIVNREDVDRLMLNLMGLFIALTGFSKVTGVTAAENHLKILYRSIAENWLSISGEQERAILVEYSQRGRNFTIYYSGFVTIASILLAVLPTIPKILDKVNPLERSRPNVYVLEGEFFVDRHTHFVELLCCDVILVFLMYLTTLALDTMYVASTEHCCSLYAIIRYRLKNAKRKVVAESSPTEDHSYLELIHTIQFHQKALNFTWTLNDSYSTSFLLILIVNIAIIPLDVCAIIAHVHEPLSLVPYVIVFDVLTLHLFIINCTGQRVLDHGISLADAAYYSEWCTAPIRTRKLLLVFMLRCTQPASLSAGGLLLINLETFSRIMRTALSYITVLASFR